MELYAEASDSGRLLYSPLLLFSRFLITPCAHTVGAIDKLEGFASLYGAAFYGLQPNAKTITLIKEEWKVQEYYDFVCADVSDQESKRVRPLRAGETIAWKLS